MSKKAQSAIEYLTTYGWMLLTVSIVSGVAYSSFGSACVESSTGFVGEPVQIQDLGLTSSNGLAIALENSRSDNIEVQEVIVDSKSITVSDGDLGPGSASSIEVSGFEGSEGCNSFDVEIVYDIEGLKDRRASGRITGAFTLVDGDSPVAAENLYVGYSG